MPGIEPFRHHFSSTIRQLSLSRTIPTSRACKPPLLAGWKQPRGPHVYSDNRAHSNATAPTRADTEHSTAWCSHCRVSGGRGKALKHRVCCAAIRPRWVALRLGMCSGPTGPTTRGWCFERKSCKENLCATVPEPAQKFIELRREINNCLTRNGRRGGHETKAGGRPRPNPTPGEQI